MQEDTTFTPPATTDLRRGWGTMDALLLFVAFLWGTNYIALKWAMAGLSPIVVTSLRFVIAAPILWYIVRHRSQGERLAKKDWPLLLFTSTLFAAAQIGYIAGLNLTTATNGALLSATMPIFVAILAPFTGAEGLGRRGWMGISLSFAGIVLVIGRPEGGAFLGDLAILAGSMEYPEWGPDWAWSREADLASRRAVARWAVEKDAVLILGHDPRMPWIRLQKKGVNYRAIPA